MATSPKRNHRSLTHGILSVSAAGLFLIAGLVGYDGLMHAGSTDAIRARVVGAVVQGTGTAAGNGAGREGALLLTVEMEPLQGATTIEGDRGERAGHRASAAGGSPQEREVRVPVQPFWDSPWAIRALAAHYYTGRMVMVRRSSSDSSRYELAGLSAGWLTGIPILLSCLGVLCLAASLRFAPQRWQAEGEEGTPIEPETGRDWNDLPHARS